MFFFHLLVLFEGWECVYSFVNAAFFLQTAKRIVYCFQRLKVQITEFKEAYLINDGTFCDLM